MAYANKDNATNAGDHGQDVRGYYDIKEEEHKIKMHFNILGLNKEDVSIKDNAIVIRGEQKKEGDG